MNTGHAFSIYLHVQGGKPYALIRKRLVINNVPMEDVHLIVSQGILLVG